MQRVEKWKFSQWIGELGRTQILWNCVQLKTLQNFHPSTLNMINASKFCTQTILCLWPGKNIPWYKEIEINNFFRLSYWCKKRWALSAGFSRCREPELVRLLDDLWFRVLSGIPTSGKYSYHERITRQNILSDWVHRWYGSDTLNAGFFRVH